MSEICLNGFRHGSCGRIPEPFIPVSYGAYPDGLPVIDRKALPPRFQGTEYRTMTLRPTSMGAFMAAMFLADALAERGRSLSTLLLPCLPGARQDRLNDKGDFLFGAKSMAREINARGFDRIVCFDPHSDVMPALIDRCDVVHITDAVKSFGGADIDAVVAPDAGAAKRAGNVASAMMLPMVQARKRRDPETNQISGFGAEPLTEMGRHYLLVDDICDGGGTFIGLADAMREADPMARFSLYVSHGIFSKGTADLRLRFENIFTTNSTVYPNPPEDGTIVIDVLTTLLKRGTP